MLPFILSSRKVFVASAVENFHIAISVLLFVVHILLFVQLVMLVQLNVGFMVIIGLNSVAWRQPVLMLVLRFIPVRVVI